MVSFVVLVADQSPSHLLLCFILLRWFLLLQPQITDSLEETYGSLRVKIGIAVEDAENVPRMESVRPGVVSFGCIVEVNPIF